MPPSGWFFPPVHALNIFHGLPPVIGLSFSLYKRESLRSGAKIKKVLEFFVEAWPPGRGPLRLVLAGLGRAWLAVALCVVFIGN